MTTLTPSLDQFRRIVVKVGSSLLVEQGEIRRAWLEALADDLSNLHRRGADVLVVSSGSIALGRGVLGLSPGALKLEDSQAAAAVGQIALAGAWAQVLGKRGVTAGQILVTWRDTEERRRYLNARATIERLLGVRAAPVINENDTIATAEIRYGDNDRLAARVATMISRRPPRCCCPTSTASTPRPPPQNPAARLIPVVAAHRPASNGEPWRAARLQNSPGGACAPRSRPPRSRRRAAPTW